MLSNEPDEHSVDHLMRLNPWTKLDVHTPPYVLTEDKAILEQANLRFKAQGVSDKYGLQLQCLPDAFTGRIDAPVVVVTLNPGYTEPQGDGHTANDDWWHANRADFREAYRENYHQLRVDFPFFFLDPKFRGNPGYTYWNKALKDLIQLCDLKRVARNLLVVEYFPYHSKSYGNPPFVPSQTFATALIRSAIARNAEILIWRKEQALLAAIPELATYNYMTVASPMSPYLSQGNVIEWSRFVTAIKQG